MLNKKLKWPLQSIVIQSIVNNIDKFESIETLKFYVSYFFISAISTACRPILLLLYIYKIALVLNDNIEHSNVIVQGLNRIAKRFGRFFFNVYEYILQRNTGRYSHTCRFHDKGSEPPRFYIILLSK